MAQYLYRFRPLVRAQSASCCAIASFLALIVAFAEPASAKDAPDAIDQISVGFNGVYKVGFWTPVEVRLGALDGVAENDPATLEIIVPDGDGVPSRVSTPITVAEHEDSLVRLLVKFGRAEGWMQVRIRQNGVVVAERRLEAEKGSAEFRTALPATARLVVVVGSPLLTEETRRKRNALDAIEFAYLNDAEQLPQRWIGYTGIDTLWLTSDASAEEIVTKSITPAQVAAIERWVQLGGQLVLSLGSASETALAADSPLARFMPGSLEQVINLPLGAAFETYVGAAHPLETMRGQAARLTFPVARLKDAAGDIELAADRLPLVVRTRNSFGSVVFAAVDLSAAPFLTWTGQPDMIALVLGPALSTANEASETTAPQAGFSDLAGQLRASLDQFEGVAVFSRFAGMIFGLIAIYALIIGPLDYLVVRRLFGKARLTWFTFPLLIVLACGAAYALVGGIKGREPKINQVDLVDIDAATGITRGVNWTHAYSPASGEVRYDFRFRPRDGAAVAEDAKIVASWMGLPGRGLGGMNPAIEDTVTISTPYNFSSDLDALTRVPITAASSKSLIARWYTQIKPPVAANLRATKNSSLFKNSTLRWDADFALANAYLLHDRWVYRLGDLQPQDEIEMQSSQRSSAASKLRDYRRIDGKQVATPFELDNLDTLKVVETLLFHEAAGGAGYTAGLESRYLHTLDMSELLRTDVAILVGQPKDAILEVDFQPTGQQHATPVAARHWTIMRIVLPVEVVER